MIVKTTRFGELEVDEGELLTFPMGLVGLPDMTEFVMFDGPEGTPFEWLQSTVRPELAYVICDPGLFAPDYRVEAGVEDLAPVEITAVEDAVVAVILSVPDDWRLMTANFAGPLIFSSTCDPTWSAKGWRQASPFGSR